MRLLRCRFNNAIQMELLCPFISPFWTKLDALIWAGRYKFISGQWYFDRTLLPHLHRCSRRVSAATKSAVRGFEKWDGLTLPKCTARSQPWQGEHASDRRTMPSFLQSKSVLKERRNVEASSNGSYTTTRTDSSGLDSAVMQLDVNYRNEHITAAHKLFRWPSI